MKTYLLSAAGVIFLSVMVSLLIPEGKMNKSIVFVMRIACILVLIRPVTEIFKLQSVYVDEPLYDSQYICEVYSKYQSEELEKIIYNEFEEESVCRVEIVCREGQFMAESVTVQINSMEEEKIEAIYAYLNQMDYINISVYAKSD